VTRSYVRDGAEIYRRSFATIRAEADLSRLPADVVPVAVRMIHACGQIDLVDDLAFSPGVVAAARTALRNGAPILHWTMVDIPASMTKLPAGMTDAPAGTMHGPNIRGAMQAYMGPRTPAGPKHRYHLQVFALDTRVGNESMQGYDAMLAAMKGHVLASGEIIGLGSAPPK